MKSLVLAFFMIPVFSLAQTSYQTGDIVPDMSIARILNYSSSTASLKKIQAPVTIIDFFGTWCAPCIKALPRLSAYKNKFKENISILLVSTEPESKLIKFISSHKPFGFPLVVDEDSLFTKAFDPPSYPFTIVLDKNLKVVFILNAEDLSETMLEKFMQEGNKITVIKPNTQATVKQPAGNPLNVYTGSNKPFVKLSQDFMYAAKTNEETAIYIDQLKVLNYADLINELKNDDDKKAFWINLYNAYTNASLHKDPGQYKSRNKFFKKKNIIIAGKLFSLDKIEHGILRRSKIKWSLGYFSKLFPGRSEKQLRVNKLDHRIHFALNCGARSCPPIAFYDPENINRQLDIAEKSYLASEINYNAENNTLQLPAILSWFRRDFGGKKKIIELLRSKQLLASNVDPAISFKKYDWTLYLDNYKQ